MENENKTNWWAIGCAVLFAIIVVVIFFHVNSTKNQEDQNTYLKKVVKVKTDSLFFYKNELKNQQPKLDSIQAELDSVKFAKANAKIKTEYYEKVKIINQYSVSDFQHHFDSLATDWIKRKAIKSSNLR
jgi:Tfp pilus assembly protein PilN